METLHTSVYTGRQVAILQQNNKRLDVCIKQALGNRSQTRGS